MLDEPSTPNIWTRTLDSQKTVAHRDLVEDEGTRAREEHDSSSCLTRSRFQSMLQGTSLKRYRSSFQHVLASIFKSSDNNASKSASPIFTGTRIDPEILTPLIQTNIAKGVDVLNPPSFTLGSPTHQPSSTSQSASTSKGSIDHHSELRTDRNHWRFMTGGSSFVLDPDGSNDDDFSRNGSGNFVPKLTHDPRLYETLGILTSSDAFLDNHGESEMVCAILKSYFKSILVLPLVILQIYFTHRFVQSLTLFPTRDQISSVSSHSKT